MNLVSTHCRLCVHIPTVKLKNSAIVFLDMDGVMINRNNCMESILKTQFAKFGKDATNLQNRIAAAYHLDEIAVQSLKLLIEKIEAIKPAYIVISSAWRQDCTLDELKNEVFGIPGLEMFKERIIGKTPSSKNDSWAIKSDRYFQKNPDTEKIHFEDLAKEKYEISLNFRSGEIAFWLAFHKVEDCDFIILDDDCFAHLEHFGKRFIHVNMLSNEDVNLAINTIFEWNKPTGRTTTIINKKNITQISTLLPKRFRYFEKTISYSDKEVGLILASRLAEKTANILAKFLTSKGHSDKNIRLTFINEPTEFPAEENVLQFAEETKKLLTSCLKQNLEENQKETSVSVKNLPEGYLKELLNSAGISEETHPQYGFYFPKGMNIKFDHMTNKNGKSSFNCLMDFESS